MPLDWAFAVCVLAGVGRAVFWPHALPLTRTRGRAVAVYAGLMALTLGLWWASGRDWAGLGLAAGGLTWAGLTGGAGVWPWIWLGVAAAWIAGISLTLWDMQRHARGCDECRAQARQRAVRVLPEGAEAGSVRPRAALAAFAGVVEELVFRGFMPWFLSAWMPWWAAAGVVSVLFGVAHRKGGWSAVGFATAAGAALSALVWATGSLWAAMLAHAGHNAAVTVAMAAILRPDPSQGRQCSHAMDGADGGGPGGDPGAPGPRAGGATP